MNYTLGQAAKATGKSKSTISAALKSGRISGSKDETGAYVIDPAELHRVFEPIGSVQVRSNESAPSNTEKTDDLALIEVSKSLGAAEAQIRLLRELLR